MTIIWCMVPEIWSVTDIFFWHSGLFFSLLPSPLPLWTQKIKILKKWKNTWTYYHFMNVYHKWQSYDVWFLRHGVQLTIFLSFWTIFCPFTPVTTWKIKILKKGRKKKPKNWRYYHITNVYHKWQSCDLWLLRYGSCWTQFFIILDHFLHFYPPNNPKNQNFE